MTSALANLQHHREEEQLRALMAIQPSVIAIVSGKVRGLDDVVEDCVTDALCQLVASGEHMGDLGKVKQRWVSYATRRGIDAYRSADRRRRAPGTLEEHAAALAVNVTGEVAGISEEEWRVQEAYGSQRGDRGVYAERYRDAVEAGKSQPGRGLAKDLGWSTDHAETVSRHTRAGILSFLERRATGAICQERRVRFDPLILAQAGRTPEGAASPDQSDVVEVLIHIGGCADCRAEWQARQRTLLGRYIAILTLPLGHVAAAAAALRAKVLGLLGIRERLGLGGVAGTGSAATLAKAGTVCGVALCAAGGGTAVVEGVSAVLPPAHHTHHAPRHPTPAVVPAARLAAYTPPPATTTPTAPPPRPASTSTTATAAPAPARHTTATPPPSSAPGDLLPNSSSSSTPSSSPSSPPASTSSSAPAPRTAAPSSSASPTGCAPGDLGC